MLKLNDPDFKNLPGVYIIKNIINGKEYIGESLNVRRRMLRHIKSEGKQFIHRSINKYGIANFQVYCEYFPLYDKENLLDLEEQMIKQYNTLTPNGYNLSERGWNKLCDVYLKRPKNHGDKVSKGRIGIKFSDSHKLALSKSHTGKSLSLEHKNNISMSCSGKITSEETKIKLQNHPSKCSIVQLSMEGDVIQEYKSIREAERFTGVNNSKITMVCKNKRISAGNFKWRYKY